MTHYSPLTHHFPLSHSLANPACDEVGCGEWIPPTIPNPAYKGKWSAPLIDNPDYMVSGDKNRVRFILTSTYLIGCMEAA